jgi:hypothetical protein
LEGNPTELIGGILEEMSGIERRGEIPSVRFLRNFFVEVPTFKKNNCWAVG